MIVCVVVCVCVCGWKGDGGGRGESREISTSYNFNLKFHNYLINAWKIRPAHDLGQTIRPRTIWPSKFFW